MKNIQPSLSSASSEACDRWQPSDDCHEAGTNQPGTTETKPLCTANLSSSICHAQAIPKQQLLSSRFSQPAAESKSDLAHRQYINFKAWRKQRHDAAVLVQKYVRRFLAKQLTVQLQCLRKHALHQQQRTLMKCLQVWRSHVCSQANFR